MCRLPVTRLLHTKMATREQLDELVRQVYFVLCVLAVI